MYLGIPNNDCGFEVNSVSMWIVFKVNEVNPLQEYLIKLWWMIDTDNRYR